MLFSAYLVILGLSAGIVGVFGRRALLLAGYVPDFDAGLAAAGMVAGVYILVQCAYAGLVQLVKPHCGKGPHITEMLSLGSAAVLLPYLLNLPIPWPHPKLADLEPVLFLGLFFALHGFFKLATLFAATQAPEATSVRAVLYVAVAVPAYLGAQLGFNVWYASLQGGRAAEAPPVEPVRLDNTYAWARPVTEGLRYALEAGISPGEHLTLRWADPKPDERDIETIHITCGFLDDQGEAVAGTWKDTVTLQDQVWSTQRIPEDAIPEGATRMALYWNLEEEPEWVRQTGLRPTHASGTELLLSGPYVHSAPTAVERPNVVLVLVEGLSADHMDLHGYDRQTTAHLTALAKRSSVWENMYTPCPDTFSTAVTIMTGVPPLVHGSTDAVRFPIPDSLSTLAERMREAGYVTAAFTEGEGSDGEDLVFGSGIERGFELFNPAYPETSGRSPDDGPAPLVPAGSRITLQRAADWMSQHREDERYFVFIRLRELRKPFVLRRYGEGFIKPWEKVPTPLDVYDSALVDVDKQLSIFTERLREMGSFEDTCLVITSPYGLDFSEPDRGAWRRGGPGVPRLTEESLHVPLIISMPEGVGRTRRAMVTLNALGRTLADFSGVSLSAPETQRSLLEYGEGVEPVALMGDPLALSLRTETWRYTWQSGHSARTLALVGEPRTLSLYNMDVYKETFQNRNVTAVNRDRIAEFRQQLSAYLTPYIEAAGEDLRAP